MQFQIPIHIPALQPPIGYADNILLTGSCFTEHIGRYLHDAKFNVMQNPNGIVFDPLTISRNVISWIENAQVDPNSLFQQDEIWHSWEFHSNFSSLERDDACRQMNASITRAHHFLQKTNWLILTLGTSYAYKYLPSGDYVANCHKVPNNRFEKHLCTIEESIRAFDLMLYRLFHFNPDIRVMFTVSPVRHIKDGIVANNRSKARLLEAVHHLVEKFDRLHYFPAYEIVIDVLRDYRFYDADLVHPNYAGTGYVLERFAETCMDASTQKLMERMQKISLARRHRPFNPASTQHQKFMEKYYGECVLLQKEYPYLDFSEELHYFRQ